VLHTAGVSVGTFNSPHLVDRWDCITVRNSPITESAFLDAERRVLDFDRNHGIGATEFELLTATAFELFTREKVQVGVVEVGLGGKGDSTNVLAAENTLVTVLTKIGLDHQMFLGNTVDEIAAVKAGIAKKGVPMVVDATNYTSVLDVIAKVTEELSGGEISLAAPENAGDGVAEITTNAWGRIRFEKLLNGGYQANNLACAVTALSNVATQFPALTKEKVVDGVGATRWAGRLEMLDVSTIVGSPAAVLVDGAHNPQAQQELRAYVDKYIRPKTKNGKVWWVLAATKGKDVGEMLAILMEPGDPLYATEFGQVDGMPWISPVKCEDIAATAQSTAGVCTALSTRDPVAALRDAWGGAQLDGDGVVVAGSLYEPCKLDQSAREANGGPDVDTSWVNSIDTYRKTLVVIKVGLSSLLVDFFSQSSCLTIYTETTVLRTKYDAAPELAL
jgi:folylpolyglutamate synthase/dihydrofolate synthase